MGTEVGEFLTQWTARLSVACYLIRVFIDVSFEKGSRRRVIVRIVWTAGCLLLLLHIVCAFHFVHGWSHRAAYEQTARQTVEVMGVHWGDGVYFNYAFALIWLADVCWIWRVDNGLGHSRPGYDRAVRFVFAFMILNATVVFGPSFWRWVAVAVCVLFLLVWRRLRVEGRCGICNFS